MLCPRHMHRSASQETRAAFHTLTHTTRHTSQGLRPFRPLPGLATTLRSRCEHCSLRSLGKDLLLLLPLLQVDNLGVKNVIKAWKDAVAADPSMKPKRVVLMSSIGVTRRKDFPFVILNGAGVLDAKHEGETAVRTAAEDFVGSCSIIRPGQLIGGPCTSHFFKLCVSTAGPRGPSFCECLSSRERPERVPERVSP